MRLEGEGSEKVVEALRAEIDTHRAAAEEAIAAARETQKELDDADADRAKAVGALESKVENLSAELDTLAAAKTAAESAVAEEEAARRGAEDRAEDLERRVNELERNEATEREGRSGASRKVADLEDRIAKMAKETREAEERLKDETERASAAQSAAGRAAAAMADVAKKLTKANADKKTAEDELALLRSKIENLDKTVDDAAKATDARDAAVLQAAAAEQRARAADQRAEEAIAAAAETATENEERKRRFAKLQTSFKETEAALLARAEAAEKAIETKDNTPSAEMEQMVGEAIEEAEAAARDAKDECVRLQTETNRLHAELDAATTETNDLRRELSDVKNKSAVLEEMAKVRSETASMGGKKGGSSSHTDIASIEAAAVKRGAEAASDEIKARFGPSRSRREKRECPHRPTRSGQYPGLSYPHREWYTV